MNLVLGVLFCFIWEMELVSCSIIPERESMILKQGEKRKEEKLCVAVPTAFGFSCTPKSQFLIDNMIRYGTYPGNDHGPSENGT
jgi:hypothetical protein